MLNACSFRFADKRCAVRRFRSVLTTRWILLVSNTSNFSLFTTTLKSSLVITLDGVLLRITRYEINRFSLSQTHVFTAVRTDNLARTFDTVILRTHVQYPGIDNDERKLNVLTISHKVIFAKRDRKKYKIYNEFKTPRQVHYRQ